MSDPEIATAPPSDEEPKLESEPAKSVKPSIFSVWPPSQRTRDAVINRLIEALSTTSVLSKRYGTLPADEASSVARAVEAEAYASAEGRVTVEDDGIEVLQGYSKEISNRMLEAVKARAPTAGSTADNGSVADSEIHYHSEEISSVEN